MSKPKPAPEPAGPMLPIGTKVMVLRPNLWFETKGSVVEIAGAHHRIKADSGFHLIATLDELKEIEE